MRKSTIIILYLTFIVVCKTSGQDAGHLVTKSRITIDKTSKPFYRFVGDGIHFWHRNNAVIIQIIGWSGSIDSAGIRKEWDQVLRYIFFDINKKQFYEYRHFSDTVKLLTSYKEPQDTAHDIPFRMYKDWFNSFMTAEIANSGINLPDTSINNKVYERLRFGLNIPDTKNKPVFSTYTMFFDCKSKGPIQFYKWLSEKYGCPITRYEEEFQGHFAIFELMPISNTLTTEETKVFDAWEKYAKEHPVK